MPQKNRAKAFSLGEGAELARRKRVPQLLISNLVPLLGVQYPLSPQCAHWGTFSQGESFPTAGLSGGIQHISDEDAIAGGWVRNHDMGDGAH